MKLTRLMMMAAALSAGFAASRWTLGSASSEAPGTRPPAAPPAIADANVPAAPKAREDKRIVEAVERGLAYLASTQDRESGGWKQDIGFKFNDRYEVTAQNKPHVGVTALALMAFIAGGHIPGRGRYGDVVARGTDYVMSCVDPDTGYVSANETRMYSHAFATLFLAEIYGMTHRVDVQAKLQQAVDLTVKSQNKQGAWRYRPNAPDSDMSIAVCQLMALRAARNIGIQVPKSTIDKAYQYVDQSAYKSGREKGAFRYQIDQQGGSRFSFALTAAGLASLMNAGFYDDPLIPPGIEWLRSTLDGFGAEERYRTYFYWYGHYYCAQVMFIASDKDKKLWDDWYWPRISKELLDHQQSDGSWPNSPGPGEAFSTAVASIILQIPNQYLPIFQR